jgi:hypothetical protein
VSVQERCTVCVEHTTVSKSFWMHMMEPLGDMGRVESYFSPEIVLTLMQDRCTVFAKRTIHSEIILDAPNGTPR